MSWPSLATEQDKSETGVSSPGPFTNPPQIQEVRRVTAGTIHGTGMTIVTSGLTSGRMVPMATDGFMAGTSTTTAMTGRMLGESVILALCVNTMMTTRQMRGASANPMMGNEQLELEPLGDKRIRILGKCFPRTTDPLGTGGVWTRERIGLVCNRPIQHNVRARKRESSTGREW